MDKTLFLCAANVGRSQMAEGYFNYFADDNSGISAALIEDRRLKYSSKPAQEIIEVMADDGIDISGQKVKLLDKQMCEIASRIIVLLDPLERKSEFSIEGKNAVNFLMDNYYQKLTILPILDPHGQRKGTIIDIRDLIKELVSNLV